jgi:excisionase family DNA binding protein
MGASDLMGIVETAALLGINSGTAYHWVSEGRLPVVRLSARCIRFRRSDVEAFIAARVVAPVEEGRFVQIRLDGSGQKRNTKKPSSGD